MADQIIQKYTMDKMVLKYVRPSLLTIIRRWSCNVMLFFTVELSIAIAIEKRFHTTIIYGARILIVVNDVTNHIPSVNVNVTISQNTRHFFLNGY